MKRYPGQPQQDDLEDQDQQDLEQPWVMGRDLSPPGAHANGLPAPGVDEPTSASRVTLAALAAALSAVAMLFIGTMMLSERFAAFGWPLMLTLAAVLIAALALLAWWRQGSGRRG